MRPHPFPFRGVRGFSLIELLAVMAVIAVMGALAALSLQGGSSSGKFNQSVSEISGILEQARAYASAQNTYVWVTLYQNTPATGQPMEAYASAFASGDGTDPFNWTGSVVFPSPATVGSTSLTQIIRMYHFKGLHLQTTTLPQAPSSPNLPAVVPVFQITTPGDSGPVVLSDASQVYWVIQFTPQGEARTGPNPVASIWFGLQPSLSSTVLDTHNIASVMVDGLTGGTTVYRQ